MELGAAQHAHPHSRAYIELPWTLMGFAWSVLAAWFMLGKLKAESQHLRGARKKFFENFRAAEIDARIRLDLGDYLRPIAWKGWATSLFLSFYNNAPNQCPTHPRRSWFWIVISAMLFMLTFLSGLFASLCSISFWMGTMTIQRINSVMATEVELSTSRGHLTQDGDELLVVAAILLFLGLAQAVNYAWHRGWLQLAYRWFRAQLSYWWDFVMEFCRVAGWYLVGELQKFYAHVNPSLYFADVRKNDVGIKD